MLNLFLPLITLDLPINHAVKPEPLVILSKKTKTKSNTVLDKLLNNSNVPKKIKDKYSYITYYSNASDMIIVNFEGSNKNSVLNSFTKYLNDNKIDSTKIVELDISEIVNENTINLIHKRG